MAVVKRVFMLSMRRYGPISLGIVSSTGSQYRGKRDGPPLDSTSKLLSYNMYDGFAAGLKISSGRPETAWSYCASQSVSYENVCWQCHGSPGSATGLWTWIHTPRASTTSHSPEQQLKSPRPFPKQVCTYTSLKAVLDTQPAMLAQSVPLGQEACRGLILAVHLLSCSKTIRGEFPTFTTSSPSLHTILY